jgi:hypothetical protein
VRLFEPNLFCFPSSPGSFDTVVLAGAFQALTRSRGIGGGGGARDCVVDSIWVCFDLITGAGSLRFSKRHRDAIGEEYKQWAEPLPDDTQPDVSLMAATAAWVDAREAEGYPAWLVFQTLGVAAGDFPFQQVMP